ncbi:MAG: tRNA (adenosine(37)-N6)-threonylcarbamoyltransferase complex ATPase subunit type 1 TsaE [Legionella sp.]
MNAVLELVDVAATETLAAQLANSMSAPLIVVFSGEIGAGKTTFIRAMLKAMGVVVTIKSPTFSLVESYSLPIGQLHHFDLYRIHDASELDYLGFRDYFTPHAICCIEWPERANDYFDKIDLAFNLIIKGDGRELHAKALSSGGAKILSYLTGEK